jgi:hypothetical protein
LFPWQLRQSLSNRFRFFLPYLVPLDVEVVPIKCHQFLLMYCYSTFLFHYYYYSYYSSTHFCPLYFSEMPWSNFMKPCRNIICPTDSDFFYLSRSTRCGCCSYHVSSISVRRVTCYAHFCVFQLFSILAVSMATAAILKKSNLNSCGTCTNNLGDRNYITPTVVGWCIAILRFFFTIIIILIILPHIFVHSISRRCLDQTLWNRVGIWYAMWSCAVKGWFFQNGCHCHGNGQNAKKLKNTKRIIIRNRAKTISLPNFVRHNN